jgi:hypothetical protein
MDILLINQSDVLRSAIIPFQVLVHYLFGSSLSFQQYEHSD